MDAVEECSAFRWLLTGIRGCRARRGRGCRHDDARRMSCRGCRAEDVVQRKSVDEGKRPMTDDEWKRPMTNGEKAAAGRTKKMENFDLVSRLINGLTKSFPPSDFWPW